MDKNKQPQKQNPTSPSQQKPGQQKQNQGPNKTSNPTQKKGLF